MISPTPPAISITDLHYAYPPLLSDAADGPAADVLQGVTCQVDRGELVALIGRVGCGKTTLCMSLNGQVPQATGGRFRGQVIAAGLDTRRHPVAALARRAGLVFQDPEAQLTQMCVEDEVAFGPENLGLPPHEIDERVAWVLEAVGLSAYRDRSPLHLSGGEKQRVAIAAMLAMRPTVLVLDDPTANLDPAGKTAIFNVLIELARRWQLAVLVATQDLELVARLADRVLVLHEGRIGLSGPPHEVFAQVARLQEWGIGAPQLAELAHLLGQRTGRVYSFCAVGQAYAQLRADLLGANSGISNGTADESILSGAEGGAPAQSKDAALRDGRSAPSTAGPEPHGPAAQGAPLRSEFPRSPSGDRPAAGRVELPSDSHCEEGRSPTKQSHSGGPQISLQGVAYRYPDGTPALQGVDLAVAPGEFVALLGPNGSGKTTLAKLLNGLLRPTAGRVLIDGQDTQTTRVPVLARTVGYAFQNPDHQIFASTVAEETAFALRLQELPRAEVAQRVAEALDRFRLVGKSHLPPAVLGTSQRRQVALAAVLAARPRVLVLDEPTGGLDSRGQQELMAAVSEFNRQGGTVLLITHDMRLMAEYATRAVVMLAGKVLFDGAPAALFECPDVLMQAHLAVPPVVRLAQRLAPLGLSTGLLTNADFVAAWKVLSQAQARPAAQVDAAKRGGRDAG